MQHVIASESLGKERRPDLEEARSCDSPILLGKDLAQVEQLAKPKPQTMQIGDEESDCSSSPTLTWISI